MTPIASFCGTLPEVPVVGPPMADAGGNYISLLKGGLDPLEPFNDNLLTLVMPLNTPASKNFFIASPGTCTLKPRVNSELSLVNNDGRVKQFNL